MNAPRPTIEITANGRIADMAPFERAAIAIDAFLADREETTAAEIKAHLRASHRLDATEQWITRRLRAVGWQHQRRLNQTATWHRPRPGVIDLPQIEAGQ